LEKLVSSSEASKILGLSLQGVHYRIKQGKLRAKKKDGKVFVYIQEQNIPKKQDISKSENRLDDLIIVKDEQILFLKKSLKWMRTHYKEEIQRIEKNQEKIIEVFKSEINLLQSAFNEMRNLYQLEHKDKSQNAQTNNIQNTQPQNKQNINTNETFGMMDIKDFFILMKQNNKTDMQIKSIILDRVRQGDKRFIFNKKTKEVLVYKSDFMDLL
jgi:hypothetical protein